MAANGNGPGYGGNVPLLSSSYLMSCGNRPQVSKCPEVWVANVTAGYMSVGLENVYKVI